MFSEKDLWLGGGVDILHFFQSCNCSTVERTVGIANWGARMPQNTFGWRWLPVEHFCTPPLPQYKGVPHHIRGEGSQGHTRPKSVQIAKILYKQKKLFKEKIWLNYFLPVLHLKDLNLVYKSRTLYRKDQLAKYLKIHEFSFFLIK